MSWMPYLHNGYNFCTLGRTGHPLIERTEQLRRLDLFVLYVTGERAGLSLQVDRTGAVFEQVASSGPDTDGAMKLQIL